MIYFYLDPAKLGVFSQIGLTDISFTPRLFFENAALWDTALKLKRPIEQPAPENQLYCEALGLVLMHELVRLERGAPTNKDAYVRGGLAAYQQRTVSAYIEENLQEQISIATLAGLAHLSPFHFCRAFKKSFGVPPHRYHTSRRIERAKEMLATRTLSVTEIGLSVGFSETSSFCSAFRKATGTTPRRQGEQERRHTGRHTECGRLRHAPRRLLNSLTFRAASTIQPFYSNRPAMTQGSPRIS
jgi:AraC family transcriptional regulator